MPPKAAISDRPASRSDALIAAGVTPAVTARAVLVVNEMVANVVRHARTEFTVSVSVDADTVRLEVFDRDTRPPALMGLDSESTSGRGLHIVAGTASDWGWQTAAAEDGVSGKIVWAELARDESE